MVNEVFKTPTIRIKKIIYNFKNMKTFKQLGIYIDFTNAFLMELINNQIISRNIEFGTKSTEKIQHPGKPETSTQNQEKHPIPSAYLLEICDVISNYHKVVLFGPNEAKNELFNLLEFDHNFEGIKIENVNTGQLTEFQKHDFLKEFYATTSK